MSVQTLEPTIAPLHTELTGVIRFVAFKFPNPAVVVGVVRWWEDIKEKGCKMKKWTQAVTL